MRYSPKPIEHYGRTIAGKFIGPAMMMMLMDDPEAWNLAYLSFDFEKRPVHTNAQFTVLISRTLATRLDTGVVDHSGKVPDKVLVRHLLRAPAPFFVEAMAKHPLLTQLPLYRALGPAWWLTVCERSRHAAAYVDEPGVDNVSSLDEAVQLLSRFRSQK